MSGLNIWTRAILRFANWVAGEKASEWCAAMASETDAAESHGMDWAFGCIGAAFKIRFQADWKGVMFLAAAPVLAYAISIPWFFAVSWSMTPAAAPITWAILVQMPLLILIALAVRLSSRGVPIVFVAYSSLVYVLLPIARFAIKFGVSPFIFFEPKSEWLTLPRNQGALLMLGLVVASVIVGKLWKRASIRAAS